MKRQMILSLLVASLFAAAVPVTATAATNQAGIFGALVPPSDYWRTIQIRPDTRYVNVRQDETVNFVLGDKAFAWKFDVPTHIRSVDLRQIAPDGSVDRPIMIYIETNPFRGG